MHRASRGALLVAKDMPIFADRRPAGHRTVGAPSKSGSFGGGKPHLGFGPLPGQQPDEGGQVQTGCPNDTTIRPRHSDHGFPNLRDNRGRACARLLRNRIVAKHGSCLGFCAASPNDSFDSPVHRSPPQQVFDHPVVRARPQACISVCRALVLLVLAAGCGELHFIPSPYTAQDVELIYSSQEHITVIRWRISSTAPLEENRFEMLGPNGYQTIDFSQSVFEGGINPCTDKRGGSCAQYIVRGEYSVPDGARPVQSVHELYGVLPGLPPTYSKVSPTLTLESIFSAKNDPLFLNIGDRVAREGAYDFPRKYERAMWPAIGVCVSEVAPVEVTFVPLVNRGEFPPDLPLTDDGIYCVGTRPIPLDGGGSTLVQARVATQPQLVTGTREFNPPVERSPIIYQIVLDLEIPVPDRCADVIQKIESLHPEILHGRGLSRSGLQAADHQSRGEPVVEVRADQRAPLADSGAGPGRQGAGHDAARRAPANSLPVFQQPGRAAADAAHDLAANAVHRAGPIAAKLPNGPVLVVVRPARSGFADGRGQLVGVLDLGNRRRILRDEAGPLPGRKPAQDQPGTQSKRTGPPPLARGGRHLRRQVRQDLRGQPWRTAFRTAAVPPQHLRAELDDHRRRSTLLPRAIEGAPRGQGDRLRGTEIRREVPDLHPLVRQARVPERGPRRSGFLDRQLRLRGHGATDAHAVRHRHRTRAGRRPRRPRRRRRRHRPRR